MRLFRWNKFDMGNSSAFIWTLIILLLTHMCCASCWSGIINLIKTRRCRWGCQLLEIWVSTFVILYWTSFVISKFGLNAVLFAFIITFIGVTALYFPDIGVKIESLSFVGKRHYQHIWCARPSEWLGRVFCLVWQKLHLCQRV